jgi:hypothetical protein
MCGQKQKYMWSKLKKEYCKENCIDRSVIEPIIIDFCDEMLIQNSNPKFRPLCLFVLTFHEYEARFVFGFRLDYKLSLFFFFFFNLLSLIFVVMTRMTTRVEV